MEFKYICMLESPIDFWDKAEIADSIIQDAVLKQMPEEPRCGIVYKLVFPNPPELAEVYLCKADNNGDTYIFSNFDVKNMFKYAHQIKEV